MFWDCKSCGTRNATGESCPYCGALRGTESNTSLLKPIQFPRTTPTDASSSDGSGASMPGCLAIFAMIGFLVSTIGSGGQVSVGHTSKYLSYVYVIVGILVVIGVVLFLWFSLFPGHR